MDDKTVIRFPNDNTVIKPRPGGKRTGHSHQNVTRINYDNSVLASRSFYRNNAAVSALDMSPDYQSAPPVNDDLNVEAQKNTNHLINSARKLLSIIIKLSNTVIYNEVTDLKYKLQDEIKQFEINASRLGVANDKVLKSRYVICTTIDEIVSSTPWGQDSGWCQQSLLSIFHGETWGGEKFFLLLDRLLKEPVKNLDILELMYLCLSLGFQGKYRVLDNGHEQVEFLREDLYRQLRSLKNDFNKELSENWRGVTDRRGTLIRFVPLWVVAAISAVILLAMFSSFTFMLDQSASPVLNAIDKLGNIQRSDTIEKDNPATEERFVKPPTTPDYYQQHETGMRDYGNTTGGAS